MKSGELSYKPNRMYVFEGDEVRVEAGWINKLTR